MKIEAALRSFLDYLAVEKGLAANTRLAYERDLEKLILFFRKEKIDGARAGEQDLVRFIHHQSRAGLAARSLARLISSTRSFYRYLALDGILDRNPTENLSSPSVWLSLPKVLSVSEVESLRAPRLRAHLPQAQGREPG